MSQEIEESKYFELSDETIQTFTNIVNKKFITDVGFSFIGNDKQKTVIKLSKISPQYEYLLKKDILVSINEILLTKFEDESINILFEEEIDKISINVDNGKIKMLRHDVSTFASLIEKYGMDKISKAHLLEIATVEQAAETDLENNFIS